MDPIGEKTLELLSSVESYNDWTFEIIEPFIGNVILEAGCGKGTFTSRLLIKGKVFACDILQDYLKEIEHRYRENPNLIGVSKWDLNEPSGLQKFANTDFDTIVCLDVLEHVEDDDAAVKSFNRLLPVGGTLILKVPAVKAIYGSLDKHLGHYRRYSKKELRTIVLKNGFEVLKLCYLNVVGIFGWYFNGVLLKKSIIPVGQLKTYEKLIPLLKFVESLCPPPIGQSLFIICKKHTTV